MMNKYDDDLRKLRDDFVRFKREVTDTLENLDESNFSGNMKKIVARLGGASAGFEAYADAKQAVARMFAEYKTETSRSIAKIELLADENKAQIDSIAKYESDIKSIAQIKQTADANGANIAQITSWQETVNSNIGSLGDDIESINTSIASIETQADKNGAFINMFAYSGNKDIDTSKGYYYDSDNDEYVFYDSDGNTVELSSEEFAGIYISAMNGQSSMKLNADIIKFGDYASVDRSGNFYAKRLFGSENENGFTVVDSNNEKSHYPDFFYAEISSEYQTINGYGADFLIKSIVEHGEERYKGDTVMYGFLFGENEDSEGKSQGVSINFAVGELYDNDNADTNATKIESLIGKRMLWGYNYKEKVLYPKEVWDFSSCVVKNLGVVPVFG